MSAFAFHPDGEIAVAKAAKVGNHLQILSTLATTSIEASPLRRGAGVLSALCHAALGSGGRSGQACPVRGRCGDRCDRPLQSRRPRGIDATIDVLPEIVDAVGGRMPVLVDSCFPHGSDIVKALAREGRLHRPALSVGPGAFGQAGVERVLGILRFETRNAMQQLGASSLIITPQMVRRV